MHRECGGAGGGDIPKDRQPTFEETVIDTYSNQAAKLCPKHCNFLQKTKNESISCLTSGNFAEFHLEELLTSANLNPLYSSPTSNMAFVLPILIRHDYLPRRVFAKTDPHLARSTSARLRVQSRTARLITFLFTL